jgi:hypothetical protein
MKRYVVRVMMNNGTWSDMAFQAASVGLLQTMVESQFGRGSFMGVVQEDYV